MAPPLEGIRVVDLTRALAGPYCTMMLGDAGADVIKVEAPGIGDETRTWGPPFVSGESAYFMSYNRNKRSITLNLKSDGGRAILWRLIDEADVLVENFSPGTIGRLGFGYDVVAKRVPAIIYCSVSGFGQTGPSAHRAAYDQILQGEGGLMSITGQPGGIPTKVGVPIADILAGMFAAFAVVTALYARASTGMGQYVDTSLLDGQIAILGNQAGRYFATGEPPRAGGNHHPQIAPYGTAPTADGYVNIAVANEEIWRRFCAALGLELLLQDPRFARNPDRVANRDALWQAIEARTRQIASADLLERLSAAKVPCGAIRNLAEVFADPQVAHLNLAPMVRHRTAGDLRVTGVPFRLARTPGAVRLPPPTLGEHTNEVLVELGYTMPEVQRLREQGAV
jgi:crotonobetainyl-CoA:carnitine CoA-transferase CaiB-like acyl-CoA transferase